MRIICATGNFQVANCLHNCQEIIALTDKASHINADFILFSELSVTGYSCGDLFYNQDLLEQALIALKQIIAASQDKDIIIIFGMPLESQDQLFNCAVVVHQGKILGIVPKTFLPNTNEFYEKRYFSGAFELKQKEIILCGQTVPIGQPLIFKDYSHSIVFGVEICEDFWSPVPVSSVLCSCGAKIIFNLSASNETVSKKDIRKEMIKTVSRLQNSIYVYCSGGKGESTTDIIYSDYRCVFDCGMLISESDDSDDDVLMIADADQQLCCIQRKKASAYSIVNGFINTEPTYISFQKQSLNRHIGTYLLNREPFLSFLDPDSVCERICHLQQQALLKKMKYMQREKLIIGVSGGLDSAAALLACTELLRNKYISPKNIIGVSMPGAGTTNRTRNNAECLMKELHITSHCIPITDAVNVHLKNISHPEKQYDITYEQTQSRERTKILMDLANQENGIVIGTGDMSEFALGWMSYSGDHISMYAVNCGLPKTVIRMLVEWYCRKSSGVLRQILEDIIATPVSPELLPLDENGGQKQQTEALVGSYLIHDFFLYHFIVRGCKIQQLFELACLSFPEYSRQKIKEMLKVFIIRFFTRQYKRNCFSDGVQLLDAGLSPRGYWRMPSDAEYTLWMNELERIK